MPVACTNCLRFHFGECWEGQKQCRRCGEWNHIERYCPQNRQIRCIRGEPPPGTRAWCDMHGLQADPPLKNKILNALKVSPGSAIWVNGICIYRGYENNFFQDLDEQRGRPFQEPMARRRSRSPAREVPRKRSRSPVRRRSYSPVHRRRERSPVRYRTPSTQRDRTPPRHQPAPSARQPNHIVPSRVEYRENREAAAAAPVRFQVPRKPTVQQQPLPQVATRKADEPAPRAPLGQITNVNTDKLSGLAALLPKPATTSNVSAQQSHSPGSAPEPVKPVPFSGIDDAEIDAHFVLGIGKGAMRSEILDAFQQRMFEIELEKMSDGTFDPAQPDGENVWDDSIRILKAAKKQLLGF